MISLKMTLPAERKQLGQCGIWFRLENRVLWVRTRRTMRARGITTKYPFQDDMKQLARRYKELMVLRIFLMYGR